MAKKTDSVSLVVFELLKATTRNVRLKTDGSELVNGIKTRGIDTPLVVLEHDDESGAWYEVLRGNRRLDAIGIIRDTDEPSFAAHFSNGVKCEIMRNLTDEQALDVIADHGDIKGLTNLFEFYMLAEAKWSFHPKYTEREMLGFVGSALPMTSKAVTEVAALREAVETAVSSIDKAKALIELEERMYKYHKGRLQTWNNVRRCPTLVREILRYTYTGEKPAGVPDEYLLYITQHESQSLFNKWIEIVSASVEAVMVDGVHINELPAAEQLEVLPDEFTDLLRELKAGQAKAPKDTTPYAKIAKAVKAHTIKVTALGKERDLWELCQEIYQMAEDRKAAEVAEAKAAKAAAAAAAK